MATPNITQQGVLVGDKQYYSPKAHINSSNLFTSGFRGVNELDNLGLIKTWSQIFRNIQPLYNFADIAKETMYVKSSKGFTYTTPIAYENPKVVEDMSESDKPGADGQEFKIAFDKPFSIGQTISYDHINNKYQLIVTQEPYHAGDRHVHHVKIWGAVAKNAYVSKEFLSPGTKYFQVSQHRGTEFDTLAASFQSEVGEREWTYHLGQSEAAYDFHITKQALLELKNGTSDDSRYRVWELVKFQKDSDAYKYMIGDPSINISRLQSDVYKGDGKAMKADMQGRNWFFEIERATMDKLAQDWTMNLMWGTGGRTQIQYDTISATPGLYYQHRNLGTVVRYNLRQFSINFLRKKIEQHFRHRLDFNQAGEILLKVGSGAYNIIETDLKKEYAAVGGILVTSEDKRQFLQGDNRFELNFTMRFNAFFLQQYPKVKIVLVHEPALDPVFANDISNPIIDGQHRLSSYTIILYDLNDIESKNIKLVKWSGDDKMRYQKLIGNVDWLDQNAEFVSSGNFSGMKGTMSSRHAGMHLVDPTKSLMFELINPTLKQDGGSASFTIGR